MGIETAIATAILGNGIIASTAAGAALITFGVKAAVGLVTTFALGALQSALTPKPKTPNLSSYSAKAEGLTQNVRQPIQVRRHLYGEARVGGGLTFIETTNSDKYLHMILVVADHEVFELGEIWFDDISIPPDHLDGSGNITAGPFSGRGRIKKYYGTATQAPDPDFVGETSADEFYFGRGVAYIYARLQFDRNVFPSSLPKISVFAKGKIVLDVRDDVRRWTPNAPLMVADYIMEPKDSFTPGLGAAREKINTPSLIAAANASDEYVQTNEINDTILSANTSLDTLTIQGKNSRSQFQTADKVVLIGSSLPGGLVAATEYYVIMYQRKDVVRIKLASSYANCLAGIAVNITSDGTGTIRKIAEPRYHGGGALETSETHGDNLNALLSACGGYAANVGGQWHISAATYKSPVYEFNQSHITSRLNIRTKIPRRDRFNLVKGVYVTPLNDGQPGDYPIVKNSFYAEQDTEVLPIDYDLSMTNRPHTAQRLAKIKLERSRQELFFEAEFSLHAMSVQPGDVIKLSIERMGWFNKEFEVITWTLGMKRVNNAPLFFVKMSLQETAAAIYDWNYGEETRVDPAPNTNLPNPLLVHPPTGLSVLPIEIRTAEGDFTYQILLGWEPPEDIFVTNGGHYDIIFKKSSDTSWIRSFRAEDEDTSIRINQVEPGINYDAGIRSVNNLGVQSQYNYLFGFTVSSPSGANFLIDYRFINEAVNEYIDYDTIGTAVELTTDFGDL